MMCCSEYPHLTRVQPSPSHGITLLLIISLQTLTDCHIVSSWNSSIGFFFGEDLRLMPTQCAANIHKYIQSDRFGSSETGLDVSVTAHVHYDAVISDYLKIRWNEKCIFSPFRSHPCLYCTSIWQCWPKENKQKQSFFVFWYQNMSTSHQVFFL